MTAPQEAYVTIFDAMDELVESIRLALISDPDITDTPLGYCWLRSDGVSVTYEQSANNELQFTLQVPMDTIISAIDRLNEEEEKSK